jgi:hypothetical protein
MNQISIQQFRLPESVRSTWIWYLTKDRKDKILTSKDRDRIGHAEYFHKLERDGYCLYHLTMTYKPIANIILTPIVVNQFFIRFHANYLLPNLLRTRNIHHTDKRILQPKVLSFLDNHQQDKFRQAGLPARLHHHAIYAVHPSNKGRMDDFIGQNTFDVFGNKSSPYMTSDLTACEAMRVLYASKMYGMYPDFLSFPDKMKRSRCNDYQKRGKQKSSALTCSSTVATRSRKITIRHLINNT